MRRFHQAIGIGTMVTGVIMATAAPVVFLAVMGRRMADPAGIAFVRAFGAALLVLGAVLWSPNREAHGNVGGSVAPFSAAVLATIVVWVQQATIWTTGVGFILVALFALNALG